MKPVQNGQKKVGIIQSNYIPWKGYFDFINSVDEFVLLDDVQYTRRDWRNRNLIKGPDGLHWLSIPVDVKGKYFQMIEDAQVSDQTWALKHWNVIRSFYQKAAYFNDYKDFFEDLYLTVSSTRLSEINYFFIQAINSILHITTPIKWSSEFNTPVDKNLRLVEICKSLNATEYLSGPSAKNYILEEAFSNEGIKVVWVNYSGYPEYDQLFSQFEHGVSIIDLIFNMGPHSKEFMKSFQSSHDS